MAPTNRFYDNTGLAVNDTQLAKATHLNSVSDATNYAFDLIQSEMDDLSTTVVDARDWSTNDQGVEPDPLNYPGQYSSKANAIESQGWAEGDGTTKKADGVTPILKSAKTFAEESEVSANLANQARIEANQSRDDSAGSALAASNYRDEAEGFTVLSQGFANDAEDARDAAQASADAADTSAEIATSSANNANQSSSQAYAARDEAIASMEAAALSETNAGVSETNAKASEELAEDYSNAAMSAGLQDLSAKEARLATWQPTTIASDIYDTSKDKDNGGWRYQMENATWYKEELGTETRGTTKEFPAMAMVTAESNKITIWDASDPTLRMWKVEDLTGYTISEVSMVEGILAVATSTGLILIDYKKDTREEYTDSSSVPIISSVINDVAITQLDNLDHPTIAVATAGGVSVINGPAGVGTVVDSSYSNLSDFIGFDENNRLLWGRTNANELRYTDDYSIDGFLSSTYSQSTIPAITLAGADQLSGDYSGSVKALGYDIGLTLLKENPMDPPEGMVNYITSDWQSGWQQGDIKMATLASTGYAAVSVTGTLPDRSHNNNELDITGTLYTSPAVTGGELLKYAGFSPTAYIELEDTSLVDTLYLYGWQNNGTSWEFVHGVVSGAPMDGVTIVGNLLHIEGTYPKTLIRLTASTPSADQIDFIYNQEKDYFREYARLTLNGHEDEITSLDYDSDTDKLIVGTSSWTARGTEFIGSVNTGRTLSFFIGDIGIPGAGPVQSVSAEKGLVFISDIETPFIWVPALDLKAEIYKNVSESHSGPRVPFTTAGAGQTQVEVHKGFYPELVYDVGAYAPFTVTWDGFRYHANITASTGDVTVIARRI